MNYPFWTIPSVGGGFLIALIAVLHVYIAHLAVGGGLFLVWTERKARKENDKNLLAYVKKHTRFFLLLTMVFGGISGVGIWFIIALVQPSATSVLIHAFVFGWAIEWVFFILEITALLLYYYLFDKADAKTHMFWGWIYFAAAFLSLVIINGILAFMLTPGGWLETKGFWTGFFNPSYFPTLFLRTAMALVIAGIFGLVTAIFTGDSDFRTRLFRYLGRWLTLPFLLFVLCGYWTLQVVPKEALDNVLIYNPLARQFVHPLIIACIVIFGCGIFVLLKLPKSLYVAAAAAMVVTGLVWIGSFEFIREIARKPYVIYNHMYSTSILKSDVAKIEKAGFLSSAKWVQNKNVSDKNVMEAGQELFTHQCLICHTVGGYNDIMPLTKKYSEFAMQAQLTGQGFVSTYMPPFVGTPAEREALAHYVVVGLHDRKPDKPDNYKIPKIKMEIPPFDKEKDDYILLAKNDLGMHCITDDDSNFVILPPANTVHAQLIKRGEMPEIVGEGYRIEYEAEPGHRHPEQEVAFWKWAPKIFGANLSDGVGLFGFGVKGELKLHQEHGVFTAEAIPVTPYHSDKKTYNPYPYLNLTAKDKDGNIVAQTKVVTPTSTEMGCRRCHGGGWGKDHIPSGVGAETSRDILAAHDRLSGTNLLAEAKAGNPRLCQSCHEDPALGSKGDGKRLAMSASVHGWHAAYMRNMGEQACNTCHPNHADGITRCLRGRHRTDSELTCVDCHGVMQDHALALLQFEKGKGKTRAESLMKNLKPQAVESVDKIKPRQSWLQEPDCLSCHVGFQPPEEANSFNKWVACGNELFRNRTDPRGIRCAMCHGAPHAIVPAANAYSENRDNIQSMQYQGNPNTIGNGNACFVCHKKLMRVNAHHKGMLKADLLPMEDDK